MIRGYLASITPVKHAELPAHEGVSTGVGALDTEGDIEVGVWEHSVGTSTDTEVEEVFVVLSGRGTVTCDQGGQIMLEPGTVGMLPMGAKTVWSITEPLRKVWITLS
ncbi:MAG: cupin domain-containing protein [Candidatus Nanopelagicales bacterium]|nr:cupin domain-containing protein [Candidatus Nanopelagicales bacterium]